MGRFDSWIVSNRLPDISYRTNPPEEIVHPRMKITPEGSSVYVNKRHIPIEAFFLRLAKREEGLRIAAYRASGSQTTISFNKHERVTLSPRLQQVLAELAR